MIYHFSLSAVAIVLGVVYLLAHLPGVLWPGPVRSEVGRFPRHLPTGLVLTFIASVWWVTLLATTDLGEFSVYRNTLLTISIVLLTLTMLLAHQFLAVRGLALLLLLGAQVILDAAFLLDTPVRLVMTVLAYVWATTGIILIISPYRLRDFIEWASRSESRFRGLSWGGVAFGVFLLILGIFVY
jgi:hypothetical protein